MFNSNGSLILSSYLRSAQDSLQIYESLILPAFYILAQLIMIPTTLRQSRSMSYTYTSGFIYMNLIVVHYNPVRLGSSESSHNTLVSLRDRTR